MKCRFVDCFSADHLMANDGFDNGDRCMQPVDPSSTPGGLSDSVSRGSSEWLISNNSDDVIYQDTAAMLRMRSCPKRIMEIAPASPFQSVPFHQHHWSADDNHSEYINGNFESLSIEVGSLAGSYTPEQPGQTSPMDSNTAFYSCQVTRTPMLNSLKSKLHEVKRSSERAQREAERQASSSSLAEEVVANAEKLIAEHVRQQERALNEANIALQKASIYEKNWMEAVRRHQETQNELETQRRAADLARQEAQAENSRCKEALAQLAEVTRKLAEERQLRKQAEERASQGGIAKQEAIVALGKKQQRYTKYSFQEIELATNNFHQENKIGKGGYGPVYKGKLHHITVAIKVRQSTRDDVHGHNEFEKEVEVLSHIHHPHMVMLIGACPEKGCIVYEYMANGSLADRLNCKDGTPPLSWDVRFRICLEVSRALLFLHSRPQPIVHRDLKPGNILLDHHFVSKISDVGIAKLIPIDLTSSVTDTLVGTLAYMDWDYRYRGSVSRQMDIYALGIVMLQLLTGLRPDGIADVVKVAVEKNQLEDVLDKSAGKWPLMEAMALARVSLQCTEREREYRPSLETVILPELERIHSVAGVAAASMAHVRLSPSSTMPTMPTSIWPKYHRT